MISKTDVLIQSDCWIISCLLIKNADWLWDDFDICVFVNKQAVHVIKNYDNDYYNEPNKNSKTRIRKFICRIRSRICR